MTVANINAFLVMSSYQSVKKFQPVLLHLMVMPGTYIESPGSLWDEVLEGTSVESPTSVMCLNVNLIMCNRGWYIYSTLLWDASTQWGVERAASTLRLTFTQSYIRKHDFIVLYWHYIYGVQYCKSSVNFIGKSLPTDLRPSMALFGGAVIPKANVAQRGGRWTPIELGRYPIQGQLVQSVDYRFYKYSESTSVISGDEDIMIDIPIHHLVVRLQNRQLIDVAKAHNIPCNGRVCRNKTQLKKAILDHRCIKCPLLKPFFVPVEAVHTNSQRQKDKRAKHILPIAEPTIPSTEKSDTQFPPSPPSQDLLDDIIRGFSEDLQLSNFVEGPCAVCGLLSPTTSLTPLSEAKVSLNILIPDVPITRKERLKAADPIINIPGPVLLLGGSGPLLAVMINEE